MPSGESAGSFDAQPDRKPHMTLLKNIFTKIPLFRRRLTAKRLAAMRPDQVFEEIYDRNAWNGSESVSGLGSDLEQTREIARELPQLLRELQAGSLLDIPCGDCYWIQHVNLGTVRYTGADIVQDLIDGNRHLVNEYRSFIVADLLTSDLPETDVIFCRDCLVHFSEKHIWQALHNIARSSAQYLVTTTFTDRQNIRKIETGQWRPLNLQAEPFLLPSPVKLIDERCTQDDGEYPDKMLGVWSVDAIRSVLQRKAAA